MATGSRRPSQNIGKSCNSTSWNAKGQSGRQYAAKCQAQTLSSWCRTALRVRIVGHIRVSLDVVAHHLVATAWPPYALRRSVWIAGDAGIGLNEVVHHVLAATRPAFAG